MMPTVMIVENSPRLGYLLERYASTSRCRPVTARFADQALALARRERPDVIVIGPGEMGRHALHELETDDATRDVPLVLCSWLVEEPAPCQKRTDTSRPRSSTGISSRHCKRRA
jgi:DNA-binding response OmpR family regulator